MTTISSTSSLKPGEPAGAKSVRPESKVRSREPEESRPAEAGREPKIGEYEAAQSLAIGLHSRITGDEQAAFAAQAQRQQPGIVHSLLWDL